jgi:hypothetical protein
MGVLSGGPPELPKLDDLITFIDIGNLKCTYDTTAAQEAACTNLIQRKNRLVESIELGENDPAYHVVGTRRARELRLRVNKDDCASTEGFEFLHYSNAIDSNRADMIDEENGWFNFPYDNGNLQGCGDGWVCSLALYQNNTNPAQDMFYLNWWNPAGFTFFIWLRSTKHPTSNSQTVTQAILYEGEASGGTLPYDLSMGENGELQLHYGAWQSSLAVDSQGTKGNGGNYFSIIENGSSTSAAYPGTMSERVSLELDKWHLLTVTGKKSPVDGVPRIDVYLDDVLKIDQREFGWEYPNFNVNTDGATFMQKFTGIGATRFVGGSSYGVGYHDEGHISFVGNIGCFGMYNTVFSEADVKQLHASGSFKYKNP